MSSDTAVVPRSSSRVTRLLVTRQDPESRRYHRIGLLECAEDGYTFTYDHAVQNDPAVQPLVGFSDRSRTYRSPRLFPLFDERILDPRRPDRPQWLAWLGVDELHDHPMELLARSGGRRVGDLVELTPVPEPDADGLVDVVFLVHGVRHVPGSEDVLGRLRVGDPLDLRRAPENPVNPRALLVTESGDPFGYVPDPLLDDLDALVDRRVVVEHVNGPEAGSHLRCLVRLRGRRDR
jgi:hypothetical protein